MFLLCALGSDQHAMGDAKLSGEELANSHKGGVWYCRSRFVALLLDAPKNNFAQPIFTAII